jgi:hypothetical protein
MPFLRSLNIRLLCSYKDFTPAVFSLFLLFRVQA